MVSWRPAHFWSKKRAENLEGRGCYEKLPQNSYEQYFAKCKFSEIKGIAKGVWKGGKGLLKTRPRRLKLYSYK